MRLHRAICLVAVLALIAVSAAVSGEKYEYPAAKVEDVVDDYHGTKVHDPYRWLEDEEATETQAWVEAETELLRSHLDNFEQKEKIQKRLEYLYDVTTSSSPQIYGDRLFFSQRSGLQNHSVLYVREGSFSAEPKVVLDPNTWSEDGTVAMDWYEPSPDGSLIAYGRSESGSEISTLYVRNVATGKDLDLQIPRTRAGSPAWLPDGSGFYYTRYPEKGSVPEGEELTTRYIHLHRLGTSWEDDLLVFGEGRVQQEWRGAAATSDNSHIMIFASLDWAKNDLFIKKADGSGDFETVVEGKEGQFWGDVYQGRLYLQTDYMAPKYRIVSMPLGEYDEKNWVEVIPEGDHVIEGFEIVGDKMVVEYLENATSRLYVYEMSGMKIREIELPSLGTIGGLNGKYDGKDVFFTFTSFVQPSLIYHYDVAANALEMIDEAEVKVDPADYETEQVWYESKDGTKVPMFLVYKKGLKKTGEVPTLLYGYGGFEINMTPYFSSSRTIWLDAGGLYAVANIRGGGEFGREWHEAGRLAKKQNVYDDFIAAGEYLIEAGYTNTDKLAIWGGSNGGLLVGACMTQRPDLYKAVVCQVPLLDMIRYHHHLIAKYWIPEYGSADDPEQFEWLIEYSPYHNVKKGEKYPATLITTGASDSRVDPCHARKMAALLQASQGGENPIFIRVESKAGHGQGMPLSKRLEGTTDAYLFLMWQLGVIDEEPQASIPRGDERSEAGGRARDRLASGAAALAAGPTEAAGGYALAEALPQAEKSKVMEKEKSTERTELTLGEPAPAFELTGIKSDKTVKLADYEDKIVVLWWHSIQCPWVVTAQDGLKAIIEEYQKKGVVFLAINSNKTEETARVASYDKEKSEFPCEILKDEGNVVADKFDARVTPHVFIVDKKGNVVYDGALDDRKRPGSVDGDNYLTRALDELLAGKPVSTPKTKPMGCSVKRVNAGT